MSKAVKEALQTRVAKVQSLDWDRLQKLLAAGFTVVIAK